MHSIEVTKGTAMLKTGARWLLLGAVVLAAPSACRDFGGGSSEPDTAGGTAGTGGTAGSGGALDGAGGKAPLAGGGGAAAGGGAGSHGSTADSGMGGDLAAGGVVDTGGEAGSGGADAGSAGSFEDGSNTTQETIQPGCITDSTGTRLVLISLGATPAAGVARTNDGENFEISGANTLGNEIGAYFGREDSGWKGWNCAGYAPRARRVIGSNIIGGFEQIFATTADGKVYWKQQFSIGWGVFLPFNLPSYSSFVVDVAAGTSGVGRSHIYILDRGRVFMRYALTDDSFAPYSEWIDLGPGPGGTVISSTRLPNGRQMLFALDALGKPYERIQLDSALGSAFGPWQPSEFAGTLVDVESGESTAGHLILYGIQADGSIFVRDADELGVFSMWHAWTFQAFPGTGRAIATAHQATGNISLLVVTTQAGQVYISQATNDAWGPWLSKL